MYLPQTKFLIVDDQPTMRKFVRESLARIHFMNIVEATDGQHAITLLNESLAQGTPFQFVMADWKMPLMTGIELLRQCRAIPAFKNLPFLLATGEREQDQIIEAARAGVSGYLIKPLSEQKIKDAIEKIFLKNKSA